MRRVLAKHLLVQFFLMAVIQSFVLYNPVHAAQNKDVDNKLVQSFLSDTTPLTFPHEVESLTSLKGDTKRNVFRAASYLQPPTEANASQRLGQEFFFYVLGNLIVMTANVAMIIVNVSAIRSGVRSWFWGIGGMVLGVAGMIFSGSLATYIQVPQIFFTALGGLVMSAGAIAVSVLNVTLGIDPSTKPPTTQQPLTLSAQLPIIGLSGSF